MCEQPGREYRGGGGEPLVLIHGGGGTWQQWRAVIPLIERDHEVLAPTLVGHYGGAALPEGVEASVDAFVDGVERDMDAAGWPTAHVVGTSLGGLVALVLAKRGRARTCTAIAPLTTWKRGANRGLDLVGRSYRFFHAITKLMARDPARWSGRPRLRRLLYWHHFAHAERIEPTYAAHMIAGFANATILPAFIAWAREHDGPDDLHLIRCPVQLLFPAKDLVFPPRVYRKRWAHTLPSAEVRILPGVGHVAMWDDPPLVAQAVVGFTARQTGQSGDSSL
jgi:pimeloyl-ACP methyl ester carboxylesterase